MGYIFHLQNVVPIGDLVEKEARTEWKVASPRPSGANTRYRP